MSGHSKWSKVKHQKAVTDAVKSHVFTKLTRAIEIAVRDGGGADPEANFRLRLAVEKARAGNLPKENIQRAIERGKGTGGSALEEIYYEAYGPGGMALLIEVATDNRQRTAPQIKNLLERFGGTLAGPGDVSFNFKRSGVVTVARDRSFNQIFELAVLVGADDCQETQESFELYTTPGELVSVKTKLEKQGIKIKTARLLMRPLTRLTFSSEDFAVAQNLIAELESLPDVQNVYANLAL